MAHRLSKVEARRIAIRAQALDADRPTDLVALVEQLTLIQIDPTAAVAPTADLVAWSRLGPSYRPEHMKQALEEDRTLFELDATIRPTSDFALYRPFLNGDFREKTRQWMEVNDSFRRDILQRLGEAGPMLSRDIEDTSVQPWQSTGWTNNRNVTQMLEILLWTGEVAIAGRRGKQRVWDLAERVYPEVTAIPTDEAMRRRNHRRLQSLGIARERRVKVPIEPWDVGDVGEEATVDGTEGTWRVDPDALGQPFTGRTALLSPFDRLVHDRDRVRELFDFEYVLEMYKPQDQRRWGYYALPILHDDRLVGKLDAKVDRKEGVLRVGAIHEDVEFDTTTHRAVRDEIARLGAWLGVEVDGL